MSVGLATAILATVSVGSATAITRGHGDGLSVAAKNPLVAERAYLGKVRPITVKVFTAVAPEQRVLDQIVTPKAGDAFAARDALAHGDALRQIRAARARIAHLAAPTQLANARKGMLRSASGLIRALKALHALSNDNDGRHLMSHVNKAGLRFSSSAQTFLTAVGEAFDAVHRGAPKHVGPHMKTPATRTSWIFAADRSCAAAAFKLADIHKYDGVQTLSAAESWDRLWQKGLDVAGRKLAAAPRPTAGTKLPRALRSRLHILRYGAKLFGQQLAGFHAASYSTLTRTQNQIHDLQPSMRALGKELRRYGAVNCGQIVALWGGAKHLLVTPQRKHHKTVSA
ncbi:MAG: hypothetical protein JO246_13930 [Frankiaceae bacterium]|nr:hypothetical protein [Frankiaceae bacterium]MBV9871531.1 hypothetical protein [Frankiaceae bacterium]